jgi:SP family general alpha glucoside:H+ symporter-like MFS transporter
MSDPIHSPDLEGKGHNAQVENVIEPDEKAAAANMKADAIEAENAEHALGVIDAVKAYPMATLWAFVSSSLH